MGGTSAESSEESGSSSETIILDALRCWELVAPSLRPPKKTGSDSDSTKFVHILHRRGKDDIPAASGSANTSLSSSESNLLISCLLHRKRYGRTVLT